VERTFAAGDLLHLLQGNNEGRDDAPDGIDNLYASKWNTAQAKNHEAAM